MADSSFDIVNKIDRQEVDNALNQAAKELSTRFDFRGTDTKIADCGDATATRPVSRSTPLTEKRVDNGSAAVAFALHPTRMEQLMAVADAGKLMPPKSTFFTPKLRSGLVVRPLTL